MRTILHIFDKLQFRARTLPYYAQVFRLRNIRMNLTSSLNHRALVVLLVVGACVLTLRSEARDHFQVLTRAYDNQRTAANLAEKKLKPGKVDAAHFGKLFMLPVDDQIYGGLLYAADLRVGGHKHNVLFVTTVNNSVYAFDADKLAE